MSYRYASTMGDRYAIPVHFAHLEDAVDHKRNADRILTGLTGHDSMRVEQLVDGEWVPTAGLGVREGESDEHLIRDSPVEGCDCSWCRAKRGGSNQ